MLGAKFHVECCAVTMLYSVMCRKENNIDVPCPRTKSRKNNVLFRIYKVLFIVIINIGVLGKIKVKPDREWYRFMLIRIAEDDIGSHLNCTTTVTETFYPNTIPTEAYLIDVCSH